MRNYPKSFSSNYTLSRHVYFFNKIALIISFIYSLECQIFSEIGRIKFAHLQAFRHDFVTLKFKLYLVFFVW